MGLWIFQILIFLRLTNDTYGLMGMCSKLKYVNFGNADLSKVENMSYMFSYCSSLEKVDNPFKTYNVKQLIICFLIVKP